MRFWIIVFTLILLSFSVVSAEMCTNAKGETYYTNKKCPSNTDGTQQPAQMVSKPFQPRPDSFEFRGVYMGMSIDQVYAILRKTDKNTATRVMEEEWRRKTVCPTGTSCLAKTDIRGILVWASYDFEDGILSSISIDIDPSDYATLKDALIGKYGKPISVYRNIVQNAMGVKYDNETALWRNAKGDVSIRRYGFRVDIGKIDIESKEHLLKASQRQEANKTAPGF
jgi:hypothetical protein